MNLFDTTRPGPHAIAFGSVVSTFAALRIIATARRARLAIRVACGTAFIAIGALMAYVAVTGDMSTYLKPGPQGSIRHPR